MRSRLFNARTLVLGGLAAAAVVGAMKNRHRVAGLIGARSSEPEPYTPTYTPPAPPVSNVDVAGPPANTATHVPAPDPVVEAAGVDEAAEEAAAAAEAANIGGPAPEYAASTLDEPVDEADRPLEEAGEGVAEGQEQAEADLVDNAEPAAGDPIEAERQIDDVIEEQDNPLEGEIVEPEPQLSIEGEPGASQETAPLAPETVEEGAPTTGGTSSGTTETPASEKSVWRTATEEQPAEQPEDQPTVESPLAKPPSDDDDSEWQTWSGRAVDR